MQDLMSLPTIGTQACRLWCVDHDATESPNVCFGPTEEGNGFTVGLTHTDSSDGTTISVFSPYELSIPDAKALIVALQRQVDRAVTA